MSISVKLDDLLHERRMTLTELADRIGMALANLSILKTGKARAIRFSTLEAICEALSCQPGDILQFEPEEQSASNRQRHANEAKADERPERARIHRERQPQPQEG
jgi:putative transcriptional regulator